MTRSALGRNGSTWAWRKLRLRVLERDGWACHYCGRPANEVDHRMPLALGGTDAMSNLVAACRPCNRRKGMLPPPRGGPNNMRGGPDTPTVGSSLPAAESARPWSREW